MALLVSMAFGVRAAQATVMVNIDPVTYANVGSTFNVNINADVAANEALVGWGFDLLFDSTQLRLNSASSSPYWDLVPVSPNPNNLTALLLANPNSPDPGLSGTGLLLATLNFTCLGPGTSPLGISVDSTDLTQGFMTFDGQYASWQANTASIVQGSAPVPEPGTMILLGFGMFALAIFGKRRTNNK